MIRPNWYRFRDQREPSDRPHHVANQILRGFGVVVPPVPLEAIATWLGVRVLAAHDPGWEGAVDSTIDPPTVWINSANAATRQRFTLGHELGHVLLHPLGQRLRDATFAPRGDVLEHGANEFATAILIPLWLLEPIVIGSSLTTSGLAALFNVSPGAMGIQLAKLL